MSAKFQIILHGSRSSHYFLTVKKLDHTGWKMTSLVILWITYVFLVRSSKTGQSEHISSLKFFSANKFWGKNQSENQVTFSFTVFWKVPSC